MEEKDFSYRIRDGKAQIENYAGSARSVIIPETLGGCPVTRILPCAFENKDMVRVHFPSGLEVIEHHGFAGCSSIEHLELTGCLRQIGNYAFYNCLNLRVLHLGAAVRSIGFGAFKNCELLEELIQDKESGHDMNIGSILDDLDQEIHVEIRHRELPADQGRARVTFTRHSYEIVANVASMCKQFESTEYGSGKYLRYCIGNDDIDYTKYDGMFYVLLRGDSFETIITVVMDRLMYPYALTEGAAGRYAAYLQEYAQQAGLLFIQKGQTDRLRFLCEKDMLTRDALDALIDASVQTDDAAVTAYLMDCRHQKFPADDQDEFIL